MIHLVEDKIAIDPMFDRSKTEGVAQYTAEERRILEEMGGFKSEAGQGLIIPEEAQDRCDQGIIKYVGPEVKHYQVGDYVLFPGHSGTLVRLEGEGLFIILREEFITCRIDVPATDIPGLFFMDNDGQYWPATHEMATTLIAREFQELGYVKDVKHMDKLKPQRAGS